MDFQVFPNLGSVSLHLAKKQSDSGMMYEHFSVQKKESSSRKQGSKLFHDTVYCVI